MKTKIIVTTLLPGNERMVHIEASGREVFDRLLRWFQSQVPRGHRSYLRLLKSWRVTVDGSAALDAWLADVEARRPGFEIVRQEITAPPSELADSLEEMREGKK